MNIVALTGRMTRDPELRRTGQGSTVASFTLAVDREFTAKNGEKETDFINCVVWNKSAENVSQYCSKGSLVAVKGRMQTRNYDNAQGQKVYVVEVVCENVQFLETRNSRGTQPQQQTAVQSQPPFSELQNVDLEQQFDNSVNSFDIMEDDIQF